MSEDQYYNATIGGNNAGSCEPALVGRCIVSRQATRETAAQFGLCYCWPVGLEPAPIGLGAVPAAPFPAILLLVKECVAPVIPVVLKAISLLDSRMVAVPPPF